MSDERKVSVDQARPPTPELYVDFSLEEFAVMELEERHELASCCGINLFCGGDNGACNDGCNVACVPNSSGCETNTACVPINGSCGSNQCEPMNGDTCILP